MAYKLHHIYTIIHMDIQAMEPGLLDGDRAGILLIHHVRNP